VTEFQTQDKSLTEFECEVKILRQRLAAAEKQLVVKQVTVENAKSELKSNFESLCELTTPDNDQIVQREKLREIVSKLDGNGEGIAVDYFIDTTGAVDGAGIDVSHVSYACVSELPTY
jgi:hypothetical protein